MNLDFLSNVVSKRDKKIKQQKDFIKEKGKVEEKGKANEKDKINSNPKAKERKMMEKTMEIKGMMCGHCEATVKKALETLPEVEEAVVSHEKGTAIVKVQADIADDVLKKTVEEKDFEVISIQG